MPTICDRDKGMKIDEPIRIERERFDITYEKKDRSKEMSSSKSCDRHRTANRIHASFLWHMILSRLSGVWDIFALRTMTSLLKSTIFLLYCSWCCHFFFFYICQSGWHVPAGLKCLSNDKMSYHWFGAVHDMRRVRVPCIEVHSVWRVYTPHAWVWLIPVYMKRVHTLCVFKI